MSKLTHSLKTALVTLTLASGAASAQEVVHTAAPANTYVPVNVGLAPMVELNAGYKRPTNTFSLGILGGSAASTEGVAISSIVQLNSEDVRGVQISGVTGWTGGTVSGLQVSGAANWAGGTVRGAQMSGVFNRAAEVEGAQISGALNVAGKLRGLQLGIVNIAEEVEGGAAVGLVNIVLKNGLHNIGVWSSDTSTVNVGTRLGTDSFYSILAVGARPLGNREAEFSVGAGFGLRLRISDSFSVGAELMSFNSARGELWDNFDDNLQKLQLVANWTPVRGVTLFGGPALNGFYSNDGRALSDAGMIAGFERFELGGDASYELGLGFSAGLQFL